MSRALTDACKSDKPGHERRVNFDAFEESRFSPIQVAIHVGNHAQARLQTGAKGHRRRIARQL